MMKDNVLASVGDKEITRQMMINIMRTMPREEADFVAGEAGRKLLLDEMIAGELLYLEAIEQGWEREENFQSLLAEAKKGLLQRYAVGKLFEQIEIKDEDLRAYYESHKDDFKQEAQVSAKHILVDSLARAEEIAGQIERGMSFEEAARQYSTCPSKQRGGDLGAFGRGKMVKEFEDVAFALEPNRLSQPVKTRFGYHLIKVEDILEAKTAEYSDVKDKIQKTLFQAKQKEVYDQKLEALKEIYPVKVNLDGLK